MTHMSTIVGRDPATGQGLAVDGGPDAGREAGVIGLLHLLPAGWYRQKRAHQENARQHRKRVVFAHQGHHQHQVNAESRGVE